jgi:cellulose synthase/poly-beta-1,6-N-acetylglucosamine synthase-like glycosyltransferase
VLTSIAYLIFTISVLGILHTYFFYPIFLTLFAGNKTSKVEENTSFKVAVLIAAYNEEKVIGLKIESILNSSYPQENITVYIGSDASTDQTNSIIETYSKKYTNIHLINFPGRTGKAGIINQLALDCKEEFFILTDANVIFEKNTIKELVKYFVDPDVKQVCANIQKISEKNISIQPIEKNYLNLENRIKSLESDTWQLVIGAEGGCYAIRKDSYNPVPKNFFMDDFYITMGVLNKGGKVLFANEAICYEDLPSQSSEEFKRKVRISIGNYQNLSVYNHLLWPFWKPLGYAFLSHKVLRWLTPFLLMSMYGSSLILALHSKLFLLLTLVQFVFFALPMFIPFLNNIKPLLFIAHFYNMNYALLKGFMIYLKGVKSSVWEPTKRNA